MSGPRDYEAENTMFGQWEDELAEKERRQDRLYWTDDGRPKEDTYAPTTMIPQGTVRWLCDPRSNDRVLQQLYHTLGGDRRWFNVKSVDEKNPFDRGEHP